MTRWPAVRTPPDIPPDLRRRASTIGAIWACVIPFALGVVALIAAKLTAFATQDPLAADSFEIMALLLLLSPVLSLPALVLAIPLAHLALKSGYAGWLVATATAGVVSIVMFVAMLGTAPDGFPAAFGSGALFGALFWISARLSTPAAFVRP